MNTNAKLNDDEIKMKECILPVETHLMSARYELYPSQECETQIECNFAACRFVYNHALDICQACFEAGQSLPTWFDLNLMLPELKRENPWLCEADSQALMQSCRAAHQAFGSFLKSGRPYKTPVDYPKRKSSNEGHHSYTTTAAKGIKLKKHSISLPKIGAVEACTPRIPEGSVKRATVSKTATGRYYCSLLVETRIQHLPEVEKEVGIDVGVRDLVSDSDGNVHENPQHYSKSLEKLRKEQRVLARKVPGSKNWEKQRLRVAKLHEKITNQRNDYQHKLSRHYVKENQLICAEDLSVQGMLKAKRFSRSLADASMRELLRKLEYKSRIYGRTYVSVPRYYPSSQICSSCGLQNENVKDLSVRNWRCTACGAEHQRDINAAKNILIKGKEMLAQM